MTVKEIIRSVSRLRFLSGLANTCFKPGHFYSPVVSLKDIKKREVQIWPESSQKELAGINLNANKQTDLINEFSNYYKDIPFSESKGENRYYFKNIF